MIRFYGKYLKKHEKKKAKGALLKMIHFVSPTEE
jgi:hypothetical protein